MKTLASLAVPRRRFLRALGAIGGLAVVGRAPVPAAEAAARKGRLKQALCRGVFKGANLDFDGMCREAVRLGAYGFDLVGPDQFPTLKKYGLLPTMVPGGSGIKAGVNDRKNHGEIMPKMREAIRAAAAAGAPNVIVLAGDRKGLTDEEGMDNTVLFLNEIKAEAEERQVTLCIELLNSKVNHKDYMCDRTAWGVEVCKRVNSPRVKLLYDIYHMQIMEGDLIATIRKNIQHIGHFHTAGVPGRHELDENQEIYYPAVMRAIVETGYQGYVAHEYTPVREAIASLVQAVKACDV